MTIHKILAGLVIVLAFETFLGFITHEVVVFHNETVAKAFPSQAWTLWEKALDLHVILFKCIAGGAAAVCLVMLVAWLWNHD